MPKKPIRPIRVEGDLAYITLTQGKEAVIDAADVPIVEDSNWALLNIPGGPYAGRSPRGENGNRRIIYLHRVIIDPPKDVKVDHRDGDGLNNRRYNLREATHSQNMQNSRKPKNSTTGFKGVSTRPNGRFFGQIRYEGKQICLGTFDTPEAAHAAYCEASKKYHGEFGRTE